MSFIDRFRLLFGGSTIIFMSSPVPEVAVDCSKSYRTESNMALDCSSLVAALLSCTDLLSHSASKKRHPKPQTSNSYNQDSVHLQ